MDAIGKFWEAFATRRVALAGIKSADEPVYDEVLTALQAINPDLWIQVGLEPGACELIITAEGNSDLFTLVDQVVAKASTYPGWTIHALRPKLGFPETIEWDGTRVVIADVKFQSVSVSGSAQPSLRLFVPDLDPDLTDDVSNALLTVLDNALGERVFSEAVHEVDVVAMPSSPTETMLPLVELEKYLAFRNTRRHSFH